ncbi:MAGE-domain-containing protein [Atractiella rhizophila]|nr:MAGE-domain-containing protein [Atractiella rhizophila]
MVKRRIMKEAKGRRGRKEQETIWTMLADKAASIARMALFTDLSRKPLRREDIVKKVLPPPYSRQLPTILSLAQTRLKHILGLEIVQLPASKTSYILRSTLPAELLARASEAFDEEDEALCVIDRGNDDEAAYGLLMVILSLILLTGRRIGEEQLFSYLKRLSLQPGDLTPSSSVLNSNTTLAHTLATLTRQGYLTRTKATTSTDDKASYDYSWGGRSDVEIGEKEVALFLKELYQTISAESGEEEWSSEKSKRFLKEVAKKVGETEFKGLADAEKRKKEKEKGNEEGVEKDKGKRKQKD